MSRITEPTSGTAKLNGRVACLLEVGTGFHPELTGRENIYLNGAILGMKRREVQEKFEEIVAFSGIERFLETPVKRYSSGMRVRLGFAVAAHLDFEILVVDEVLAVGDAEFQRKCLGRMTDVAAAGRTVIFVSHNLAVLQRLCSRAIRLRDGQLVSDGLPDVVVGEYLDELASAAKTPVIDRSDRRGSGAARVVSLEAVGDETGAVAVGRPLAIRIKCSPPSSHADVLLGIYNQHGTLVTSCDSRIAGDRDERHSNHEATFECQISEVTWTPGRYRINVAIYDRGQLADHVESACVIDVHEGVYQGRSISNGFPGSNIVPHCWMRPE
ncbi:MAG: Wzt carbohydrate-binding domain-containing protein [Pirellulales bacterium]|nr:Wzt carbohydrate-binding domain-containing protein [Pirellulales bacterium]